MLSCSKDTASISNIEILQCFQSQVLRMIVDASCYMPNTDIRRIFRYQQFEKKSVNTALSTVQAPVYTRTA
jgi:hypothetical protein